jgi:ribosomal protein S18 acetylase RimI-like enzyme
MTAADLVFADSLRAAVGWNQTIADWERLLALEPAGCFVAEHEGKPVGTATTTCYSTDLAWIGMVLVHPDARRHGFGKLLLNHCIEHLRARRIRCIKLDATPLGKALYDRLGFRDEWTLARWERPSTEQSGNGPSAATAEMSKPLPHSLRPLTANDWPALLKLDLHAFGVPRQQLLESLARQGERVLVVSTANGVAGYGMVRRGSRADYLGPVVADSAEAGTQLVTALLSSIDNKPVYWDIPDQTETAVALAKKLGFVPQRPLIRMFLGENHSPGEPRLQFAIADPATG